MLYRPLTQACMKKPKKVATKTILIRIVTVMLSLKISPANHSYRHLRVVRLSSFEMSPLQPRTMNFELCKWFFTFFALFLLFTLCVEAFVHLDLYDMLASLSTVLLVVLAVPASHAFGTKTTQTRLFNKVNFYAQKPQAVTPSVYLRSIHGRAQSYRFLAP
jgi:hypothetical protein